LAGLARSSPVAPRPDGAVARRGRPGPPAAAGPVAERPGYLSPPRSWAALAGLARGSPVAPRPDGAVARRGRPGPPAAAGPVAERPGYLSPVAERPGYIPPRRIS